MKKIITLWLMVFALILTACQQSDTGKETKPEGDKKGQQQDAETVSTNVESNKEQTLVEQLKPAEELPTEYQSLLSREPGELAGKEFVEHEDAVMKYAKENLPKLNGEVPEKDLDLYFLNLLSFVQESYTGPESLIESLKFQAFGDPSMDDKRFSFKEQLNVEIILDASGSMMGQVGGRSKMDLAKEAINKFVKDLPKDTHVGLRVYGHKGSGSDSDKQMSCQSSDLVFPVKKYNEQEFQKSLNKFKPAGWTPIALALNEAGKDLKSFNAKKNTNIIFLVSDGIDTCGIDPVGAAKELSESNVSPILNIIGFDVDSQGQHQLKEMAKSSKGLYSDVKDQSELTKELEKVNQLAEKWESWKQQADTNLNLQQLQNGLDIFGYTVREEQKRLRESTQIFQVLTKLWLDEKYMSKENYEYLRNKNTTYHDWIKGQIDTINAELKSMNLSNYTEAKKELETHYKNQTSTSSEG